MATAIMAACSSTDIGPYAPTSEEKRLETAATTKAMCRIENQERCAHVIENRLLMSRFFAPETLGGMDESEKFRGRSITTKFVVEAVAAINQCQRVTEDSVILLRDMKIDKGTYFLKATKPVSVNSACFITPEPEAS
ncbi:MAG: hypothetical protein AAF478_00660 [Pseudomonadota bacterium]